MLCHFFQSQSNKRVICANNNICTQFAIHKVLFPHTHLIYCSQPLPVHFRLCMLSKVFLQLLTMLLFKNNSKMITNIWHFLHTVYSAKHVFISPSQGPHRGAYYDHHPVIQVRKLRLRERGSSVLSPTTSRCRADTVKQVCFQGLRPLCRVSQRL